MAVLRAVGAALALAGGAGAAATGGTDLTAIAALITSLSGVLATVGGLWLARNRKSKAVAKLEAVEAERDLLIDVLLRRQGQEGPEHGNADGA